MDELGSRNVGNGIHTESYYCGVKVVSWVDQATPWLAIFFIPVGAVCPFVAFLIFTKNNCSRVREV